MGFYLFQGCFEGGAAAGVGRALRKDIFLLQVQGLKLPGYVRFVDLLPAQILRAAGKRLLLACCHLFLHRLAFPTTSHRFIVRVSSGVAPERLRNV